MNRLPRHLRRWRKLRFSCHWLPAWVDNHGVLLPTKHPLIPRGVARQILLAEYETKELEIVSRRLAPGDRVLEIGAGLGFLSAFCAKRIGSENVFACEANPACLPLIHDVYAANGVRPTLLHGVVGHGRGQASFFISPEFWASSAVRQSDQEVRVSRLDLNELLVATKSSFLVVDIEGGEKDLFFHTELPMVKKICVETHPDVLGDAALSAMFDDLFAKGFVLDFSMIRKNVFFLYRP